METRRIKILGFSLLLGGLVLCGIGLRLLLSPAQYRAETRLIAAPEPSEIAEYQKNHSGPYGYDPRYIEVAVKDVQCGAVLTNVVVTLNLNDQWVKEYPWRRKLETKQTAGLLKRRMNAEIIRGTEWIRISVTCKDRMEAAKIANAIANSYSDYRLDLYYQHMAIKIEALQKQYQVEEERIRILQAKVDSLRTHYRITNDVPPPQIQQIWTNPSEVHEMPLGLPYWEEKRALDEKIESHKLLGDKIASEKLLASSISPYSMVVITDAAQPPTSPLGRDYPLGLSLFVIGLFPTVGGFLLLRSSRRQFP